MRPVTEKRKGFIWVLIYTKAKQEIRANENLKKQGFKTYLPLITPNNKNSNLSALVPVFPRYLFVQINLETENWTSIKSSYGVINIVMFADKVTSIPNSIINAIRDKIDKPDIYYEEISIVDYQKGDPVPVLEGSFAGIDAIFLAKRSKDRVRLLLKLFNSSIIADIEKSNIGHKESIKSFKLE